MKECFGATLIPKSPCYNPFVFLWSFPGGIDESPCYPKVGLRALPKDPELQLLEQQQNEAQQRLIEGTLGRPSAGGGGGGGVSGGGGGGGGKTPAERTADKMKLMVQVGVMMVQAGVVNGDCGWVAGGRGVRSEE